MTTGVADDRRKKRELYGVERVGSRRDQGRIRTVNALRSVAEVVLGR
jgi:hypothetical protein